MNDISIKVLNIFISYKNIYIIFLLIKYNKLKNNKIN